MRRSLIALLAALPSALVVGGVGAAGKPHVFEAELVRPAPRAEVRAAGMAWRCEGVSCRAEGSDGKVTARDCNELARQAGAVRSYRSDVANLPADALERCNVGLAAAPTAAGAEGKPTRIQTRALVYMGVWAADVPDGGRAPQSEVFRRATPTEAPVPSPSKGPPARGGGAAPATDEPVPVWAPRLPVEPRQRATDE